MKNHAKGNKIREKEKGKEEEEEEKQRRHHTTDHKSQVSRGVELRVSEGAITFVPSPRSGRVYVGWEKWRNKIVSPTCTRHPPCTHKDISCVWVYTIYTIRVYVHFSLEGATRSKGWHGAKERERERKKNRRVGSNRVSRNEGNFILRKEG